MKREASILAKGGCPYTPPEGPILRDLYAAMIPEIWAERLRLVHEVKRRFEGNLEVGPVGTVIQARAITIPLCRNYPLDSVRRCANLYVSMIHRAIAEAIKHWRQVRGLSQRALAERTDLSYVHIARLELGQGNPTVSTLESLAKALEIPVVDLLIEPKKATSKKKRGK
jgi:DNA-binding XRE family transcriptional regulator